MKEREFNLEIRAAWRVLNDELGVARTISSERSLEVDPQFRDVALNPSSSYRDIYRTGLSRSHYNILLEDYAYLQFSMESRTSWRLAYWPNPWITGAPSAAEQLSELEKMLQEGLIETEEFFDSMDEMQYLASTPPIRFEYAPQQYKELVHPAAHFHIGRHDENRWPSAVMLGPSAFTLIIAKLYYPEVWRQRSNIQGAGVPECIDERLLTTMASASMVHDFSERESRNFHFGKNMLRGAEQQAA